MHEVVDAEYQLMFFCCEAAAAALVNNETTKPDKVRSSRPADAASSHNGLFDDDDEDLFARASSKPTAASRKGSSQFVLSSPRPRRKYKIGRHSRKMGDRSSRATLRSCEIGQSLQDQFQTVVFCVPCAFKGGVSVVFMFCRLLAL